MIRCWITRVGIQNHVEHGGIMSEKAERHMESCADCREILQSHLTLGKKLRAERPPTCEASPFLHARIMNSVAGAGQNPQRSKILRIFSSVSALGVACLLIAFWPGQKEVAPANTMASWTLPALNTPPIRVTASLESELEYLKADTQNAARALAASFLPSEP